MWCIVWPRMAPAPHRRARRRQAAGADRDRLPRRAAVAAVVVGHADHASRRRARPRGGDVAAEADERAAAARRAAAAAARSAAQALAVAPRSSRTPAGTRTDAARRGRARPSASRARSPRGDRAGAARAARRERSSSASRGHSRRARAPGRRSGRRRRRSARRRAARPRAPRSAAGSTRTGRPARAFTRESSESARKRLQARSIAYELALDRGARGVERPGVGHAQHDASCRAPPTRASASCPAELCGAGVRISGATGDDRRRCFAGGCRFVRRRRFLDVRGFFALEQIPVGRLLCAGADSWAGSCDGRRRFLRGRRDCVEGEDSVAAWGA